MKDKRVKVYTYKRVSTSMQVDGYSLDAQNERMEKYAELNDMVIVGSYGDEGKSGKNIAGRIGFPKMLNDIAVKKDNDRLNINGHRCDYHRQWNEDMVNGAVAEIIGRLVDNPNFAESMKKKINESIDTHIGVKDRIARQLDALDITDRSYDRKYDDLQNRLEQAYEAIAELEDAASEFEDQLNSIRKEKVNADNVYQYLILFSQTCEMLSDIEKKRFYQSFIEDVQIYEEQQENGQLLKSIRFKFPVFYRGTEVEEIS